MAASHRGGHSGFMRSDTGAEGQTKLRAPVLVVGAGPVGMVTALELAHHGISSVLAEQSLETTSHPKVDITSSRSMELLARMGIAQDVRAAGVGPGHSFDVIWSTGMTGEMVTAWRLPSVDEMRLRIQDRNDGTQPHEPWQRISQVELEPVLRARCIANPLIELSCGWRFELLDQDDTGVTSQLTNVMTGANATIRSRYLVGCDGGASAVRRSLKITRDGSEVPELPGAYLVHFKSRDLATLHRHGQFWHYFAFRYVMLAQDEIDTWTLHAHAARPGDFDPPPPDAASFVRSTLGVDLDIDKVLLTSPWTPKFLIARRYRAGRVLLAGDAVHQMFPTGGYGMNTGLADAVDIGWKLAAVIKGYGGQGLIDSYENERRPVGVRNMQTSERHLGVHLRAGEMLSQGVPAARLARFLQAERGENEYTGVELGYRYGGSSIVCPDGSGEPAWNPDRYLPTTWPGSRAPSVILADGTPLYDLLGPEFTLVDFAGDGRADALLAAADDQRVPMRHAVIADDAARGVWERDLVIVRPDQHVAWRGATGPRDPEAVIRRIRGATSENTGHVVHQGM